MPSVTELAVELDSEGRVELVLYAHALQSEWRRGRHLTDLIDAQYRGKAARFLEEIRTASQASHVELGVRGRAGALCLMSFSGVQTWRGSVLIAVELGPPGGPGARAEPRPLVGSTYPAISSPPPSERDPLSELMALNNDLAAAQRELARGNALLRYADAEKNRILGMVAHELRTPLTVVAYAARLIGASSRDEETALQRRFSEKIESSCSAMRSIVDDLVDFTAIESGKLSLCRSRGDLVVLVQESIELLQGIASEKGVRILRDGEASVSLDLDARRFQQVLVNLLSNAIKFSPPDGSIRVEVGRDGAHALVSVQDEGPGIPSDVLPVLFEPFRRGPAQPTGGEASSGLGLAIARRIVHAHDGEIRVDSVLGEGARFCVRIPSPELGEEGGGPRGCGEG